MLLAHLSKNLFDYSQRYGGTSGSNCEGLKGQAEGKDIHVVALTAGMISYANYIETVT